MLTFTDRDVLERYYRSLAELPQRFAHLPAVEVQGVMKKVHSRWKPTFPAGEEFGAAAKTILNACNDIILGKITIEQAKERCEPLWKDPA